MLPRPFVLSLASFPVLLAAQTPGPRSGERAARSITADDVRSRVGVLADDSMRGRDTPSPELEKAATWIAGEFRRFGLRPGGDHGSYVQRYPLTREGSSAPNVIGILEGSDPLLRSEYVLFTAHMDHLGVASAVNPACRAQGADSICNGADDDASGTAAVMLAARAFALLQPRPRRSLVFMTVSGEEKGLWGSEYFAEHPTVPLQAVVADLNTDMVGRNWRDTIAVIGKEQSDLGATLDRVAAAHPELHMTPVGDMWPLEDFYERSDHYNFARRGIPILFFFNGTHPDYHAVTDDVVKIDAEKEARIVKLLFYLGLEIADATARPRWDPESYKRVVEAAN